MPVEVILPKVDMDMSHGTLATRHVAEGDLVQQAAPLFDIETDKAAMEIEASVTGYLRGVTAKPGDKVPVGATTSLTLIAPAGPGPEIDAAAMNGIIHASRTESLAPWLRQLTATPVGISDDFARAAMRSRDNAVLRACQADMSLALFQDGVQSFDLHPALQRIELPTQILWGRCDHILPPAHGIAAEGEFALHLLSGVGHIPQIKCPDRVARIAQRLINAVEVPG